MKLKKLSYLFTIATLFYSLTSQAVDSVEQLYGRWEGSHKGYAVAIIFEKDGGFEMWLDDEIARGKCRHKVNKVRDIIVSKCKGRGLKVKVESDFLTENKMVNTTIGGDSIILERVIVDEPAEFKIPSVDILYGKWKGSFGRSRVTVVFERNGSLDMWYDGDYGRGRCQHKLNKKKNLIISKCKSSGRKIKLESDFKNRDQMINTTVGGDSIELFRQ